MGWRLGTCLVASVALITPGAALAARKCARPKEVTAIQAAAVQQQLMVAALTCHDIASFNAFQTGYARQLRRSDWRLRQMFRRLFRGRGMEHYHAFKTRLANNASMRSIQDNAGYCQQAGLAFAAALAPGKLSLADFVSGIAVHDDAPVDRCDIRVANSLAGAAAVPAIVPTPNPLRLAAMAPLVPATVTPMAVGQATHAPLANNASPVTAASASSAPPETASAAQAGNALADSAKPAAAKPAKPAKTKKSSGWLSSLFH
jgi:hypothetical protein